MTTKRHKPTGLFGDCFSAAWARRQHKAKALRTTDKRDLEMIAECKDLLKRTRERIRDAMTGSKLATEQVEQAKSLKKILRDCRRRIGWRKAAAKGSAK